jgi:hypothetical protein
MTDFCLFTIEHSEARRIFIRGVADITEPIDDFDKIIKFYNGTILQHELPPNPYEKNSKDYKLFNELLETIQSNFEEIGSELVFAEEYNPNNELFNKFNNGKYDLNYEKVII